MGLSSAGWLAEKLPTRVDKATVKHDFIYSTYTLHSERGSECLRRWWLQKRPKIGSDRNREGRGGGRQERRHDPFLAALHGLRSLK